jgi:hypothetical protein
MRNASTSPLQCGLKCRRFRSPWFAGRIDRRSKFEDSEWVGAVAYRHLSGSPIGAMELD